MQINNKLEKSSVFATSTFLQRASVQILKRFDVVQWQFLFNCNILYRAQQSKWRQNLAHVPVELHRYKLLCIYKKIF